LPQIVTFNLRDFPDAVLRPHGVRPIHPGEFIEHLLDLNPEAVCEAVRRIRRRLANPPISVNELLESYDRHGLAVSRQASVDVRIRSDHNRCEVSGSSISIGDR
jgi:hypothetical protein